MQDNRDSYRDSYLDAGMRAYIAKFARRNYWRIASWYDLDDLIQDGFFCYAKCRARYVLELKTLPEIPTSPDHRKLMMRLVMTAFTRHVHDLSIDRTECAAECCFADAGEADRDFSDEVARTVAAPPGPESLVDLLAAAPREVADLIAILVGDAVRAAAFVRDAGGLRETAVQHVRRVAAGDGRTKFRRSRLRRRSVRETTNELYCRLLGLDPREHDVRRMVRDYLG